MDAPGRDDLKRNIGCGGTCYQQEGSTDLRSQDYLLISGGKYVKSNKQDDKELKFEQLFCGNGLANENLGVRVELPGPAVLR